MLYYLVVLIEDSIRMLKIPNQSATVVLKLLDINIGIRKVAEFQTRNPLPNHHKYVYFSLLDVNSMISWGPGFQGCQKVVDFDSRLRGPT